MAKFKLRGPDGGTYAITADTPEAAHAALYGGQTEAAPKVEQPPPQDNQKQTEELPWYTKAAKGLAQAALHTSLGQSLAYGAAETRTKDANTLRKSGALGFNPDQIDKNTEWLKQQAGLENYDPASAHFADSSKPWTERIGYLPRTLLEGAPTMAQHIAASSLAGPVGMLGSTALSEGGTSVDRVREADKTDPNAELTPQQKLRVGSNVALQTILNEVGGRATLGATAPVKKVGMEGVKQAAGNVAKAAGIDAAVGGYGAGADKAIVEGQVPSVADVVLPGIAGAAVGTAFRAPGGIKEAATSTRYRALGSLDPQSRGEMANLLEQYKGNFDATQKHLNEELSYAAKGLDDVTKQRLSVAEKKINSGQRLDPEEIQAVSSVDNQAGKLLQNMDTFSVMKGLNNGGLGNSSLARALNPFSRGTKEDTATDKAASWFGKIADSGLAYHTLFGHVSPEVAALIAGGQATGLAGLHGIDMLTGASNPAKVITDKYAGSAAPRTPLVEARAKVKAFQDKANTDLEMLDKLEASDRDKAAADEKAFWEAQRQHRDMVVNSDKTEEQRVLNEQRGLTKALREQKYLLGVRERSAEPVNDTEPVSENTPSPTTQAKVAVRVKKSAGETKVEHTPLDYHEAVVPGAFQDLVIRQPKSGIGKESGWKQGVANNIGFRTPALKAMADIASGADNQKALAQLEMDWTHNTRTPEGGKAHFEDFLNESKLSEDQKQKLRDIYDSHEKELKTSWKKAK